MKVFEPCPLSFMFLNLACNSEFNLYSSVPLPTTVLDKARLSLFCTLSRIYAAKDLDIILELERTLEFLCLVNFWTPGITLTTVSF